MPTFLNFIFSFCFRSTAFGSSTQSDPIAFYLTISGLTVHDWGQNSDETESVSYHYYFRRDSAQNRSCCVDDWIHPAALYLHFCQCQLFSYRSS